MDVVDPYGDHHNQIMIIAVRYDNVFIIITVPDLI